MFNGESWKEILTIIFKIEYKNTIIALFREKLDAIVRIFFVGISFIL